MSQPQPTLEGQIKEAAIIIADMCDKVEGIAGTDKRLINMARMDFKKGFEAMMQSVATGWK